MDETKISFPKFYCQDKTEPFFFVLMQRQDTDFFSLESQCQDKTKTISEFEFIKKEYDLWIQSTNI